MSVIPRNHAEELYLIQPAPGRVAHDAVTVRPGDLIVHHIQGTVPIDDHVILRNLHHIRHQLQRLGDPVQHAIVAAVRSVFTAKVRIGTEHIHHAHRKIQLGNARLASRHIQVQVQLLRIPVLCLQLGLEGSQFLFCHLGIGFHFRFSCQSVMFHFHSDSPVRVSRFISIQILLAQCQTISPCQNVSLLPNHITAPDSSSTPKQPPNSVPTTARFWNSSPGCSDHSK